MEWLWQTQRNIYYRCMQIGGSKSQLLLLHLQPGSAAVGMGESLWNGFGHVRGMCMTGVRRYEEAKSQLLSPHTQQGSEAVSVDESRWNGFGHAVGTCMTGVCRYGDVKRPVAVAAPATRQCRVSVDVTVEWVWPSHRIVYDRCMQIWGCKKASCCRCTCNKAVQQ